jgi:hypothetical protein
MARQNINTGSAANDGTGDTLRSAGTKINANFTELYSLLGGDAAGTGTTTALTDSGLDIIHAAGRTKVGGAAVTGEISIDFPDSAGNIVVDTATQTLTNKTLTSPTLTSAVLTTPQINDTSADHQYIVAVSELAADRTITLPLLTGDDVITFNAHTQTLTNKTLTTPTITRPIIQEYFADSAGDPVINITAQTYGKTNNRIRVQNSASSDVTISAFGGSTNIGIDIDAKGNKPVKLSKYAADVQTVAPGATIGSGGTNIIGSIIKLTGATGSTVTLNDAVTAGTILHVIRDTSSGTQTITPASFLQGTTVDFTPSQTATLIFDGSNWYKVGGTASIS